MQPVGIQVQAYNRDWIVKTGMEGFLTVADGSCGEPLLLECTYDGTGDDKTPPVLLTAAGVTFDRLLSLLGSCPTKIAITIPFNVSTDILQSTSI